MAAAPDLAKMVPGFEFLQNLMQGASAGIPGMGQWIAPTLDPAEIERRIQELRTVQFWLEQNARLLAATIQALEVQRMTLSTLQGMNLPMADVRNALKIGLPRNAPAAPAPAAAMPSRPEPQPASGEPDGAAAAAKPSVIDPLQWWGALTQQFTALAAQAVKDVAAVAPGASRAAAAAGPDAEKPSSGPAATPPARRRR